MLKFSLIIATLNRTTELDNLFASVAAQRYSNVECILVDQNTDGRLNEIVSRWQKELNIQVFASEPGLSRARNVGLSFATGDIIAFPDDDCWYPPLLLKRTAFWFERHPEFGVLTVGAKDEEGVPSGNRWIQRHCEIRAWNAFRTTFSSTIFVRNQPGLTSMQFDVSLGAGAGTRFGCGEETDYVLRLMRQGERGYFDSRMHIGHPRRDMLSGTVTGVRARGYGLGMGRVLRKSARPALALSLLAYDMLRAGIVAAKGNTAAATLSFQHGQGIAAGFLTGLEPQPAISRRKRMVWADSHPHLEPQVDSATQ